MPADPEKMRAAVQAYLDLFNAKDTEAICELYADDAIVEDPIGTEPKKGMAAIREFYTMAVQNGAKLYQQGSTRIAGNHAAFAFEVLIGDLKAGTKAVDVELPEGTMKIEVIDVFTFNDESKVSHMRAYWGPDNVAAG